MRSAAELRSSQTARAFLEDFATLSSFGATEIGGVDREAATSSDAAQRAWFSQWLRANGAVVRVDAIGNIYGLWELVPGTPYVLAGSHLDSQPQAGRFDGAYGVLAAAHACRAVAEDAAAGRFAPRYNVAVVDWFNEEGSRFQPSMMGSSVFTGKLALDAAHRSVDRAGISVQEALESIGASGADAAPEVAAYAEIHVEQGRHLEREAATIGLVEATWAARKYRVRVIGDQSHTGATPMAERQDALLGAAMLITETRAIADRYDSAPVHTSVSEIHVEPNSPVVVAREARILIDLRAPDEQALSRAFADLEAAFRAVEDDARVRVDWAVEHEWGISPYQRDGVDLARDAADQLGLDHRTMMTIAGHDSTNMKDIVPTVMLFVPSVDGIAHNQRELTYDDDLVDGLQLLISVTGRLASGEMTRQNPLSQTTAAVRGEAS